MKLGSLLKKIFSVNSSYWRDVILQASGNSIAQFTGILGLPILTRLYSPENFASQAIFIQITVLLVAFITFRYEYFIPLLKDKSESVLLTRWVIKIGFFMTVFITFIIAVIDKYGLFEILGIKLEYYYYLSPITAYLISISFLYQHESQRVLDYKQSAFAEVISKISYVLSGIVGSLFNTGIALILTTIFGALGKILTLRKYFFSLSRSNIKGSASSLVHSYKGRAFGMVMANTLLAMSGILPIYIIGSLYGADTLGQFSLVMATIFLPSGLIGSAVGNVFYQRAGVLWNNREFDSLTKLWAVTLKKLISLALPVYVLSCIVTPWAYPFIFGSDWVEAGQIAQVISIAAFFAFIAGPLDRLSLVLGAAYYLPCLHIFRLIAVCFSIIFAIIFDMTLSDYIVTYSILLSIVYIFDILFCRFYLLKKFLV